MPANIQSSIDSLQDLSTKFDPHYHQEWVSGLQEVIIKLQNIAVNGVANDLVIEIRKKLLELYNRSFSDTKLYSMVGYNIHSTLHQALVALTLLSPINDTDPIDQEPILDAKKIVNSSGHIFNIDNLIQWHNSRPYRGSSLNETDRSKWLLNPITNKRFCYDDELQIFLLAASNALAIENVRTQSLAVCGHLLSPQELQQILMLFSPENRYSILLEEATCATKGWDPDASLNLLHRVSFNSEQFDAVMNTLSDAEKLSALWNVSRFARSGTLETRGNNPILIYAKKVDITKLQQIVSAYYHADERYALLPDSFGYTLLHYLANNFERLSLCLEAYPIDLRLRELTTPNKARFTALDLARLTKENIIALLSLLPMRDRFTLLMHKLKSNTTLLESKLIHDITDNAFIDEVCALLPHDEKLQLLRYKYTLTTCEESESGKRLRECKSEVVHRRLLMQTISQELSKPEYEGIARFFTARLEDDPDSSQQQTSHTVASAVKNSSC